MLRNVGLEDFPVTVSDSKAGILLKGKKTGESYDHNFLVVSFDSPERMVPRAGIEPART